MITNNLIGMLVLAYFYTDTNQGKNSIGIKTNCIPYNVENHFNSANNKHSSGNIKHPAEIFLIHSLI